MLDIRKHNRLNTENLQTLQLLPATTALQETLRATSNMIPSPLIKLLHNTHWMTCKLSIPAHVMNTWVCSNAQKSAQHVQHCKCAAWCMKQSLHLRSTSLQISAAQLATKTQAQPFASTAPSANCSHVWYSTQHSCRTSGARFMCSHKSPQNFLNSLLNSSVTLEH